MEQVLSFQRLVDPMGEAHCLKSCLLSGLEAKQTETSSTSQLRNRSIACLGILVPEDNDLVSLLGSCCLAINVRETKSNIHIRCCAQNNASLASHAIHL